MKKNFLFLGVFLKVLIVAECNVNVNLQLYQHLAVSVLIVAECNVNSFLLSIINFCNLCFNSSRV